MELKFVLISKWFTRSSLSQRQLIQIQSQRKNLVRRSSVTASIERLLPLRSSACRVFYITVPKPGPTLCNARWLFFFPLSTPAYSLSYTD